MAATYLPGAARPANPSRRAFIGAASLTIPVAAMAALPNVSNPRREWDRLVAEFHRVDAVYDVALNELNVAETHYFAGLKSLGVRPKTPNVEYPRPIHDMTIGELQNYAAPAEELEGYDAALAHWRANSNGLELRTKRAAEDRWHDAIDKRGDAAKALFAYPAPDCAALLLKLDLAEREYHGAGSDLDGLIARHIFADMRRFARGEA
jgi:hypothetical protein